MNAKEIIEKLSKVAPETPVWFETQDAFEPLNMVVVDSEGEVVFYNLGSSHCECEYCNTREI